MDDLRERLANLTPEQRARLGTLLQAPPPDSGIPRRRAAGPAPLSFAQERLWFISMFEPDRAGYNVPTAAEIEGHLDCVALERAFHAVIDRHEILRTTYANCDGVSSQIVGEGRNVKLDARDFRGCDRSAVDEFIAAEVARPFDLSAEPVIRVSVLRVTDSRHILLVNIHHIACDGWSMGILNRELSACYAAFAAGTEPELPPLPIQYADYAEWQRRQLSAEALARQVEYWKTRLAGAEALDLGAPGAAASHKPAGGHLAVEIDSALCPSMRRLCLEEGVTMFMLLLAAFQALLARHTGQTDISVGMPMANRDTAETEDLVGFFVNTLVMRGDLSGDPTFRTHLARVRESALDAYSHHDLPFEKLVEALQPERSLTRSPLFQAMLGVQPAAGRLRIPGATVTPLRIPLHSSKFDLMLSLDDHGEFLRGGLTFNCDVLSQAAAARLMDGLGLLIEAAVRDPDLAISKLPVIGSAERRKLLTEWNAIASELPERTVLEEFERAAAAEPDRVAVTFEAGQVSYGELNRRASRVADVLRRQDMAAGSIVGIFLERSPEMIAAVLGILKLGAAYLPLDPAHPDERLRRTLADSGAAAVLTTAGLRARVAAAGVPAIDVAACASAEATAAAPVSVATPAYVLYTSGSTGTPKGVAITHGALANVVAALRRELSFTRDDAMPALTTLAFDIAALEIFLPLTCGGRIAIVPRSVVADGEQLAAFLAREQITVAQATPTSWQMLVDAGWPGDRSLRVISGGEPLSRGLAEALLQRTGGVWNCYGPTETAIYSTVHRVRSGAGAVPIGRPLPNTRVYVVDRNLELTPPGARGELCIGGVGVAPGYIARPKLTGDRFIGDPFAADPGARLYRTGDLVRWTEDGDLEFLGRLDDQVKIRGFRVELGEVEAALRTVPGVRQAAAVVRDRQAGGAVLDAFVVGEGRPTTREIQDRLKQLLPDYMVPAAIRFVDALPVSPTGKLDRKSLAALAIAEEPGETGGVPPQTPFELLVAEIWSELLRKPVTDAGANFFSLGGHSLLAARVVARLRKALGMSVPVRMIFESPTVAELALSLAQLQAESLGDAELLKLLDEIEGAKAEGRAVGGDSE